MANKVKEVYKDKLEMVSVRLVKDPPLMSKTNINSPEAAVKLLGEYLCQMDREVICVINMRTDGVPINCSVSRSCARWREVKNNGKKRRQRRSF